jgi:hypothetical protein
MAITPKKTNDEVVGNTQITGKFVIHKAKRSAAKIRVALSGVSGSGKTYSAIMLASGLGKKILVIDTENGSGDLYASIADYDVLPLDAPYTSEKYVEAIKMGEDAGYDVIIIDSITHEWAGTGGILERQTVESKRTGNGYTSWSVVTAPHQNFIDSMINSKCHIIATMRSKQKYAIDTSSGKTIIRKLGLNGIQKEDTEFEFTLAFDIDAEHNAYVSKDRTQMFEGKTFKITKEIGEQIVTWLNAN